MPPRWLRCYWPPGSAQASGITNSSEDLRTGWYPGESTITPGLVSGGTFGQEWSASVEGQVYAQPLLDENTLLVATEKNHVYGLQSRDRRTAVVENPRCHALEPRRNQMR